MRLLLDTHIAVWLLMDDRRLSAAARELLSGPNNDVVVSTVALWEIAIKRVLNRRDPFAMPYSAQETYALLVAGGADILAVTAQHTFAVERLPAIHRDPFDRLMAAQALHEGMRLLTADRQLAAYSDSFILA